MSQAVIQEQAPRRQASIGRAVPLECAICRRGPDDGTPITASHSGIRVMLCNSHI